MKTSLAALAAFCLASCGGGAGPANESAASRNAGNAGNGATIAAAPAGNASAGSGRQERAAANSIIETPPRAELETALRTIEDPQLAAQVAPDGSYEGTECVVHLGQIEPVPAGAEPALERAIAAWRRAVIRELGGENEANQMIGSSVNMLAPTPPALRRAAVAWCLANAPAG
jgi:hypothetical protein